MGLGLEQNETADVTAQHLIEGRLTSTHAQQRRLGQEALPLHSKMCRAPKVGYIILEQATLDGYKPAHHHLFQLEILGGEFVRLRREHRHALCPIFSAALSSIRQTLR